MMEPSSPGLAVYAAERRIPVSSVGSLRSPYLKEQSHNGAEKTDICRKLLRREWRLLNLQLYRPGKSHGQRMRLRARCPLNVGTKRDTDEAYMGTLALWSYGPLAVVWFKVQ